jgi:hypothetical protein
MKKHLLLITLALTACNPPEGTTIPYTPSDPTSNAVPAGMVRVHQFHTLVSQLPACTQYTDSLGVLHSLCQDDFTFQAGAVKDFPESQVTAIKAFYSGCTLTHEYIEQDHTELMYDCTNNCTFVTIACTCTAGTKRRYTCTNPGTGATLNSTDTGLFYSG